MRSRPSGDLVQLKALASDVRLHIIELLADPTGNFPAQVDGDPIIDGVCADFIRDKVQLSASTTSRHLTVLVDAGLLRSTRKRGWTFYRRNDGELRRYAQAGLLSRATPADGTLPYLHVDVFASTAFGGNSLSVFFGGVDHEASMLQAITGEMRHFESVFLAAGADGNGPVRARVFDLFEELPFAGHPLLGAAAGLHHRFAAHEPERTWTLSLGKRRVRLDSSTTETGYRVSMGQGRPVVGTPLPESARRTFAAAYSLRTRDLRNDLPIQVISTGLAYVIVPVRDDALERASVAHDLSAITRDVGAQFSVLFEPSSHEIRHWNNDGFLEDVATGSAAGTIGAYAVRHGLAEPGEELRLTQGRFAGRPSVIHVTADDPRSTRSHIQVTGDVVVMGSGELKHRK